MTETQEILRRIAALRTRLDRASGAVHEAEPAPAETADAEQVQKKIERGAREAALVDSALRPLKSNGETLPRRLTARALRLLHQGRELLAALRGLAEKEPIKWSDLSARGRLHRQTLAMLESVLRTVQTFPPAPSAQLRLCEGLEATLDVVEERVRILHASCVQQEKAEAKLELVAELFRKLTRGQSIRPREWNNLTEEMWNEARLEGSLVFFRAGATDPYRFAAAHGLNVAQVLARVLVHEPEWHGHLHECLMAALVHDIGMTYLPADLLAVPGAWDDAQRRQMEQHSALGAQLLARAFAPGGLIVEATQDHHERLDGSGYPAGRRDLQISTFTRLLSTCDVYAALACGRPQRAALDTRTALTDTLLQADQGALDRFQAEKLLRLGFYPAGSVVEMADGAAGVVVAAHPGEKGLLNPSKPIVLLLTETDGQPLPRPCLLDLLRSEERSILRALPAEARQALLGATYPEMA
jgi:hypothetical protein